jgi:hypothetical protein
MDGLMGMSWEWSICVGLNGGTLKSYAASAVKAQFWQPEAVKAVLQKVGGK